jgi:hypothetical protein
MKQKPLRILALVTVGVTGLGCWVAASRLAGSGFATPADCLEAYREACQNGDVSGYLGCLGEPLHTETRTRHSRNQELAETLRAEMSGVKSWVELPESVLTESTAEINVDIEGPRGLHRTRFNLEKSRAGWLIVAIGPPQKLSPPIGFGTHVGDAP